MGKMNKPHVVINNLLKYYIDPSKFYYSFYPQFLLKVLELLVVYVKSFVTLLQNRQQSKHSV